MLKAHNDHVACKIKAAINLTTFQFHSEMQAPSDEELFR